MIRPYRVLWATVTVFFCALGAAAGWWLLGPTRTLVLVAVGSAATSGAYWLLVQPSRNGLSPARRRKWSPSPQLPDVGTLSTEQLWSSWSASSEAVTGTADPHRMGVLAELRGAYLDEMQRRDPHGFDAWLTRYARAGNLRPRLPLEDGPPEV